MAARTSSRKSRTATPPESAAVAVRVVEGEPDPLDALLAEFSESGHYVKLQRQTERAPRVWQHIGRIELSHDMVEDVREQFGGGAYKALIYTALHKYKRTVDFHVAGRPKVLEGEEVSAATSLPVPDYVARIEALLERMKPAAPPVDPLDTALKIVALMQKSEPAVAGADVATTLKMLQDAEERGERRGMQLGELKAGGGGGDSLGDVAAKYLPGLIDVMRANTPAHPAPVAYVPTPVAPASAPAPAIVPALTLPAGYEWLAELLVLYPRLHQQAVTSRDPEVIADFAVEQFSDELADRIAAVSARDEFVMTVIGALPPQSAQYHEWFVRFLERMREALSDDGGAADGAAAGGV